MRFVGRSTDNQLSDDVGLMKPSWCPVSKAGLIYDLTAEVELEEKDDEILPDLAVIHHLLALVITKQDDK